MQNNLDGLKSTCNLTELVLKGKDIELLLLKKQVEEKLSMLANVELKDLPRAVGKQICFVPGVVELGRLEDPDLPLDRKKGLLSINDGARMTLPSMVFGQKGHDRDIMAEAQKVTQKRTAVTQTEFKAKEAASAAVLVNRCMQTEYPERYDRDDSSVCSSNGGSFGLETRGTETDVISTLEKAVNTRSRSLHLQQPVKEVQHTDSKEESPSSFAEGGAGGESPATRRIRRRRERIKPMEVSVRPTTIYNPGGQSEGYGILTYSSSIEESTYNNEHTPAWENMPHLVASVELLTPVDTVNIDLGTMTANMTTYANNKY